MRVGLALVLESYSRNMQEAVTTLYVGRGPTALQSMQGLHNTPICIHRQGCGRNGHVDRRCHNGSRPRGLHISRSIAPAALWTKRHAHFNARAQPLTSADWTCDAKRPASAPRGLTVRPSSFLLFLPVTQTHMEADKERGKGMCRSPRPGTSR